jgi:hypothetical protein
MFRGPGSIIVPKECHQGNNEKSKDKRNGDIPEDSLLRRDVGDRYISPLWACLDYLLRPPLDLVSPRRFAVTNCTTKIAGRLYLSLESRRPKNASSL